MSNLPVVEPDRQVAFYLRLEQIRRLYLQEALREAVQSVDIAALDHELGKLVDPDSLNKVASFGIRGEVFFPVPILLRAKPTLLGYYRLLFGVSQKFFYKGDTFGSFKAMEERGVVSKANEARVEELCESLIKTGEMLVDRLGELSLTVVHELQLLTLGPQLKGGENNEVGEKAVRVFGELLTAIVKDFVVQTTPNSITIKNPADRLIFIKLGSDPDVDIADVTGTPSIPLLAIEVKGGLDNANKHNRLGEAEKSHLTAKQAGHNRFWTVVNVNYASSDVAEKSPTTQRIWRLDRLSDPTHAEYKEFRNLLGSVLGLPVAV